MAIDHDDSEPPPLITKNPEDYDSDSDDEKMLSSRE